MSFLFIIAKFGNTKVLESKYFEFFFFSINELKSRLVRPTWLTTFIVVFYLWLLVII